MPVLDGTPGAAGAAERHTATKANPVCLGKLWSMCSHDAVVSAPITATRSVRPWEAPGEANVVTQHT
ncbi:MAG TPA: hypothetical protein VGD37_07445 [Kofleriaceae bacterium]|jgi:hypothetical protein